MNMAIAEGPLFAILSALVEERAGLHYGPKDRQLFLDKAGARAAEAGFASLLDYYYFLRYDEGGESEIQALVDALVVNETFFFRELAPLRVVVDELIAPLVRRGLRPRVWCAACASGEEPLTLAMLLADAKILPEVDLVASDISERALVRARSGRYGKRSVRDAAEAGLARRWLAAIDGGYTVSHELVRAVSWRRINLCEPTACFAVGPCDVILCRNVLIYFSDETTVQVVDTLTDALKQNGALFVGIAESLLRFGTRLVCQEKNQVFYYRKAA